MEEDKAPHPRGLASPERWRGFRDGLLTETAFILGLTLLGFLIAAGAAAVW